MNDHLSSWLENEIIEFYLRRPNSGVTLDKIKLITKEIIERNEPIRSLVDRALTVQRIMKVCHGNSAVYDKARGDYYEIRTKILTFLEEEMPIILKHSK